MKNALPKKTGHIQIDFGLDTSFLHEEVEFTAEAERNVRSNVHKLVEFTREGGKECGGNRALAVVGVGREPGAETDRPAAEGQLNPRSTRSQTRKKALRE